MKIGIIGSGQVGQVLAKAFKSEGHDVILGTRNTAKPEAVEFNTETGIAIGTFDETARFGELLVLVTKGDVAAEAMELAGLENFAGKVVIDATNPLAALPPTNGVLHFFTTLEDSLMERLQKLAPEAKFVKAFNSVGNACMYKPALKETPTMFICGNDEGAKQTVTQILESFGWEAEDMGKVEAARAIEPLCILWCIPGFLKNSWVHAFKLLRP
jgi:predicted dinucleotide-binding enzyme